MGEPTTEWRTDPNPQPSDWPCKLGHTVEGTIPGRYDQQFNGIVCDCKRIVYVFEHCSCENAPILKQKPNPNY